MSDPLDRTDLSDDSDEDSTSFQVYCTLKDLEHSLTETENSSKDSPISQKKLYQCAGFCEKCKPESRIKKERLIDCLKRSNNSYYSLATSYLAAYSEQFYCFEGGQEKI